MKSVFPCDLPFSKYRGSQPSNLDIYSFIRQLHRGLLLQYWPQFYLHTRSRLNRPRCADSEYEIRFSMRPSVFEIQGVPTVKFGHLFLHKTASSGAASSVLATILPSYPL